MPTLDGIKKVRQAMIEETPNSKPALSKGIMIGAIGGVLGMLAMDIVIVIEFAFAKLPLSTYLILIGSVFGGGILTGLITHLVFGAVLGALSCMVIIKIDSLRIKTVHQGIFIGLVIGLLSIPLGCIPFAILIEQPILKLISFSSIPHLVWGAVLGLVVGYGIISFRSKTEQSMSK
jgi:uncharacterized membrane protein YagU involved in acid resistance